MDAAQPEQLGGESPLARVTSVKRRDAHGHAHLLPENGEIGRHQHQEERRAGHRTVDPGEPDGVADDGGAQLGGTRPRSRLSLALGEPPRRLLQPVGGEEDESLGRVVGIGSQAAEQSGGHGEGLRLRSRRL